MNFFPNSDTTPLPSPRQLKNDLPIKNHHENFIHQSRQTIIDILNRKDSRQLLIVGPCSIHDIIAAKEYASNLKKLSNAIADSFFVVMRVYCEKPRTATGWKGLLYDPALDNSCDVHEGLRVTRKLLLDLAEMGIPAGTEFLDPLVSLYISDLISWGSVGARTVSSQIHRQMASGLSMPLGFKNSTDGNLEVGINAIMTAKAPHVFAGANEDGRIALTSTGGNPYTHLVLRGGEKSPNYDPASIDHALQLLEKANLPARLVVDCSHDNSDKKHYKQPHVFQSIIDQIVEGNKNIMGIILESHLHAGSQVLPSDPSQLQYGVSLTDPCVDWTTTEFLLHWGHKRLSSLKEAVLLNSSPNLGF